MPYQSFSDQGGDSNSIEKLGCLRLPADMTGTSFLDLGCNEGFFCGEALRRGATRVVGVDANPTVVESARARFPTAEFVNSTWNNLPEGKFDTVLFSSAIHYEKNPQRLCRELGKIITSNGRLILECGLVEDHLEMWVDVQRHDGSLRFPTRALLTKQILDSYSVRYIGRSIPQKGDPLERHVFHCFPYRPIVLLVGGESLQGKTTLAIELARQGVSRVDQDHVISIMAANKYNNKKPIYEYLQKTYKRDSIDKLIDSVWDQPLGLELVREICSFVPYESRTTVLEGYAFRYSALSDFAQKVLTGKGFKVWRVQP